MGQKRLLEDYRGLRYLCACKIQRVSNSGCFVVISIYRLDTMQKGCQNLQGPTLLLKAPIGLRAPTTWYMPHEILGVFHMLLRHGRGFGLSDLEEAATALGHRPLGSNWFRPEKVKATSSFACQLQSTCKDLSRVDLDLPEGLLVGLGYAATTRTVRSTSNRRKMRPRDREASLACSADRLGW